MKGNVNPIPKDYHSVTPGLVVDRAAEAIEYYKKAFGADQLSRMDGPDGKVMHATIKIGDSIIMLSDECGPHDEHEEQCVKAPTNLKGTTTNLYLYVDDVDSVFDNAIEAGGQEIMPTKDMFWGDRVGVLRDPFGHSWTVATQVEIVSEDQIKERAKEFMESYSR